MCSVSVMSMVVEVELPGVYRLRSGMGRPYRAWKGVMLMAKWCDVLYQYSAKYNILLQVCGASLAKAQR